MITVLTNNLGMFDKETMETTEFLLALGLRIKKIRLEKNLTQQELASLCDFEKSNMSRIENGGTNPTILTLRKISEALEVNLAYLFEEINVEIPEAHNRREK
jgi:transcriptional regulator with XRE-family HTH domain